MMMDTSGSNTRQGNLLKPTKYAPLKMDCDCRRTQGYLIKNRYIYKTRGQRPNESQKAAIINMMKSVGEIASKMWPVV